MIEMVKLKIDKKVSPLRNDHITADNLNTQVLKTTLMVMLVKITLPANPTNISAALENRSSFTANEYSYLSDCQSFRK